MSEEGLQIVSVIEIEKETCTPMVLFSFIENEAGNKEAENIFISQIKKYLGDNISEEEIEDILDDGYFETNDLRFDITHTYNSLV